MKYYRMCGVDEYLILILPGEVKFDLANFDVKFQTKFLNLYLIL